MKDKLILVGVLLVIGIFLVSPISAATQIDKGGYAVYSESYGDGYFKWQTFKYSNNCVKVYAHVVYPDSDLKGSMTIILKKISKTKLKISMGAHTDWGNKASSYTAKTKRNAVQYYKGYYKYSLRYF